MTPTTLLISAGLSFIILVAVFWPLERAFPARPGQRFFRPEWFTDLLFFLGQYLLWGGLVLTGLAAVAHWLDDIVPPAFRAQVAAQPWWLQATEVILLSDFCVYWGHRAQHHFPFLWRFHAVHHSAEHLDWLAAHREHPLDSIYTQTLINLPPFLLGFPLETLVGLIAFRGLWAIYIHSNVRLPIGPLRWFIGAPELHHWHHDRDQNAGNYANIPPSWTSPSAPTSAPITSPPPSASATPCPAATSAKCSPPSPPPAGGNPAPPPTPPTPLTHPGDHPHSPPSARCPLPAPIPL